jgi:intracellular septation protein
VFFWLLGVAFLGSFWIGKRPLAERMLSQALGSTAEVPHALWRRLNWLWVAFSAVLGVLNLAIAFRMSERTWVHFKVIGLPLVTALFITLQLVWLSRRLPAPDESTAG